MPTNKAQDTILFFSSVSAQRGLSYAPGDRDALFEVFEPANAQAHLPDIAFLVALETGERDAPSRVPPRFRREIDRNDRD
jgi:hypothetical protein